MQTNFKEKKFKAVLDAKDRPIPGLTHHIPTGKIYIRKYFRKLGIPPLQISTGEVTLGRAKSKASVLIQQHVNRHLGISDTHVFSRRDRPANTVRDIALWVLENHTPNLRKGTQLCHNIYIRQLIDIIGDKDLNSITADTLKDVVSAVNRTQRVSKYGKVLPPRTTFMDYAKNMNLIMRHAYQRKMVTHLIRFKNPDRTKETGRLLTRTEVTALWDVMNEDTRDQFVLALECLMRLREAICAPWSEINLTTGEWTLSADRVKTGSKTGRGRSFILSPNALSRMRARYERRNPKSPWIFPSPTDPMKPIQQNKTAWVNAKETVKIKGQCRWHDLRHTGLTWVLLGDPDRSPEENEKMIRPPMKVSAYCGASMKTIEKVYLKKRASHTADVSGAISIF